MPFLIRVHHRIPLTFFLGFWSLITFLLLSSGPAYAEWVWIGTADEKSTVYADLERIRRTGHLAKTWTLRDYKTAQDVLGKSYSSSKLLIEFDCQQELFRTAGAYAYSENMGNGIMVQSDTEPAKWQPVVPDSIGEIIWKLACGKK
jgi:hypothetical protein